MISLEPGRTTLRNVLVRGDSRDPLALQLHLGRLLSAADLGSAGLPASACLVVRHLNDPLPGKLRLESGMQRPPVVWERAMQQALELQARHAARPAHGPVPADATAVLFADRAELLACLAADFLSGLLSVHWWWRSLFPNADLPRAALAAWQDSPEELPAALEQLARGGQASAFVRKLDSRTTHQMQTRLVSGFGLHWLERVFRLSPQAADPDVPVCAATAPSPPWHALVPESLTAGLSIEQQTLLGVALAVQRAPQLARSPAFSNAVHTWRQAALFAQEIAITETRQQPATGTDELRETARKIKTATEVNAVDEIKTVHEVQPERNLSREFVSLPETGPMAAPLEISRAGEVSINISDHSDAASNADLELEKTFLSKTETHFSPLVQPNIEFIVGAKAKEASVSKSRSLSETESVQPATPPRDQAPDDPEPRIEAGTAQGRPPAVEPAELPIPQSVLTPGMSKQAETMAVPAFGETLLVETVSTRFGGVFYLLNLALALGLYGDFSMPLDPGLALSPWDFLALLGRALIGPALEEDPLWRLLARLAGREAEQTPGQGFEPPDGLPLAVWLEKTVVQIHSQLLIVLELKPEIDLNDLLFAHPARIEQSSSRLDVFFCLAEHPIQIRLAGLDRDPGWIPAAGRSVVYHYD